MWSQGPFLDTEGDEFRRVKKGRKGGGSHGDFQGDLSDQSPNLFCDFHQ